MIQITKTPFERCAPVGAALVKKAREEKARRKQWADNEIGQSAKEMATYFRAKSNGRVMMMIDPDAWTRIFGRKNAKKHQ